MIATVERKQRPAASGTRSKPDRPLLAIVGPTASGKTEAAIGVAEALGAEILSIDATTIYRGMDVGTAKPSAEQRARVPHHLIDVADPTEPFSVARFQAVAAKAIREVLARGRVPLLVGGSGLYYRAVVDRLRFPGTEHGVRSLLEAEASAIGPARLHQRLASYDPAAAARIDPANVRRTIRALEVSAVTGRPFSVFARDWERFSAGRVRAAGIDLPKDALHRRIEERWHVSWPGLLEETSRLCDGGFHRFLTSWQAIGYAEAVASLRGTLSEDEAVARTIRRTKALARRQLAWFRRDPRVRWFTADDSGAVAVQADLCAYLRPATTPLARGEGSG